jgi:NADH:ubiquinone oxidoreductase subunit 6 (subunit J)
VTATEVVFWIAAVIMIASALGVVLIGNIVHAAIFFAISLGGVAAIYLILTVEFLALVQLLIYGGAVVILVLFALMLTRARERPQIQFGRTRPIGILAAAGLMATFIGAAVTTDWVEQTPRAAIEPVPFEAIGDIIFTVFLVPFIVVGVLLSVALDGAILLATPDEED